MKTGEMHVRITLMDGEHRIQVTGDPAKIRELVRESRGILPLWRSDLASCPERRWRELRAAWARASGPAAEALSKLKREAWPQHFLILPDCPFRREVEYLEHRAR